MPLWECEHPLHQGIEGYLTGTGQGHFFAGHSATRLRHRLNPPRKHHVYLLSDSTRSGALRQFLFSSWFPCWAIRAQSPLLGRSWCLCSDHAGRSVPSLLSSEGQTMLRSCCPGTGGSAGQARIWDPSPDW